MNYWRRTPNNVHLSKYIDCYWFLEKEVGDLSHNYPKLNPDPTTHLIIASANNPYQYDQGTLSQRGYGSHWIFPHRHTFTMDHSSPFQIIGIKFRTGALYSLEKAFSDALGLALEKIQTVDLNKWMGLDKWTINELLEESITYSENVCTKLDELFEPCIGHVREDKHSELVRQVFPLLSSTSIADIGAKLHRSQRTVERSFLRVTELTLKQCQSMIRLENILNYLYQRKADEIDWGDLAAQFEFSDQPHLIRHLKSTIGKTPGEYVLQRDLTIDIYGDFEVS